MTERFIPPYWCRDICHNTQSRACTTVCAKDRQAEYFLPDFDVLPPVFPYEDYALHLTPAEQRLVVGYYLTVISQRMWGEGEPAVPESVERMMDDEDAYHATFDD